MGLCSFLSVCVGVHKTPELMEREKTHLRVVLPFPPPCQQSSLWLWSVIFLWFSCCCLPFLISVSCDCHCQQLCIQLSHVARVVLYHHNHLPLLTTASHRVFLCSTGCLGSFIVDQVGLEPPEIFFPLFLSATNKVILYQASFDSALLQISGWLLEYTWLSIKKPSLIFFKLVFCCTYSSVSRKNYNHDTDFFHFIFGCLHIYVCTNMNIYISHTHMYGIVLHIVKI